MKIRIDLTGQKFGRLSVISFANKDKHKNAMWKCICDCGNEITTIGRSLRTGHTKSCGCFHKERISGLKTKHGMSKTAEYHVWQNMISRCYNSNNDRFEKYGGRGISVDPRWKESFENFIKDIGKRPSSKHSIERKNVNGNYEKSNCVWDTIEIQVNNKTTNHIITAFGETKTIANWSRDERCSISYKTLSERINKLGWEPEKAITYKARKIAKKSAK